MTCVATGSDEDGDELSYSYSWVRDGIPLEETSSILQGPFVRDQVLGCEAAAIDPESLTSAPLEAETTVANAIPVISNELIYPLVVYTDDVLTLQGVV